VSRNTSVPRWTAPLSGTLSLACGVFGSWFGGRSKPHGYCVISSECASTITSTVRALRAVFVTVRPSRAPRTPSGTTSVRRSRRPSTSGRS
jgi:hypothetical protein